MISKFTTGLKKAGKTIVSTNGCFDLVHAGHLKLLREAKRAGDALIVGLNSDSSVKKLKGRDRPVFSEKERARLLLSLEYVDYVVIFRERDCINFVRKVKSDVHVKDAEYGPHPIEEDVVRKNGGKLLFIDKVEGLSSTNIINKYCGREK